MRDSALRKKAQKWAGSAVVAERDGKFSSLEVHCTPDTLPHKAINVELSAGP